jgi:hypothetical protein
LYQHFELQVVSEMYRRKIRDSEDEHDRIAYTRIVTNPDILKVVALFDVPERFITLPAGEVYLHDTP